MWMLLVSRLALGQTPFMLSLDLDHPDWSAFEHQVGEICQEKRTEWDFDTTSRWRVSVALQFADAFEELAGTEIPGVEAQIDDFRTDASDDPAGALILRFETLRGNLMAHAAIFRAEGRMVPLSSLPSTERLRWPARAQARRTCAADFRATVGYMIVAKQMLDAYNSLTTEGVNIFLQPFQNTAADAAHSP